MDKIMSIMFNPNAPDTFVTCGVKHVNFWKAAGNGLVSKRGLFGKKGTQQTMLCIAFDKQFAYTGISVKYLR